MEQQRLFAWSETSGLLDLDAQNQDKILDSNIFNIHRQTVLDLLMQVQCLFKEFTELQRKHNNLITVQDDDGLLGAPEKDAKQASFPITPKKRDFIKKAMLDLRSKSKEGWTRLRWTTFDKEAFEGVLVKFSALNDSMMNIMDHSLQVEIRHTVQDTNRGILLLHHKIADLSHLVLALKTQLKDATPIGRPTSMPKPMRMANSDALKQLSTLAKFKAFNETIDPRDQTLQINKADIDFLGLAGPGQQRNLFVPRYLIEIDPEADKDPTAARCEALMKTAKGKKRVWIEWKDYETGVLPPGSLTKTDIVDRVRKLAALLNHGPKTDAFRTPHCLGFFDKADPSMAEGDVDILDRRLGLIFERPTGDDLHVTLPPVSLRELLEDSSVRKPRVTERIKLSHAISSCLLYLHAVNWLHKGLRSHNIIFFRTGAGHIDFRRPYLSGFDFSRPGGSNEMTDAPGDDAAHDLYRHPYTQASQRGNRERSKKSFDIYSLGVVFVELAHWQTVESVLGIDLQRRDNPDVVRQVRNTLLKEDRIADVGANMGERYEIATRKCLRGEEELGLKEGDDETADEVAETLSLRFYQDVVKRLEEVIV